MSPSRLARLLDAIVDPVHAFRGLDERPTWVAPFAAAVLLHVSAVFVFYRPEVTMVKVAGTAVLQSLSTIWMLFVWCAVVWGAARVWNVDVSWSATFAVVSHVHVVNTLVTLAVASVMGTLLPESMLIDIQHLPYTNLGFLADGTTHLTLHRLAAQLDARAVYSLILLWLGLHAIAPLATRSRLRAVVATFAAVRLSTVAAAALLQ
jgi:hypothetical protein